jgi:hypothetical protein
MQGKKIRDEHDHLYLEKILRIQQKGIQGRKLRPQTYHQTRTSEAGAQENCQHGMRLKIYEELDVTIEGDSIKIVRRKLMWEITGHRKCIWLKT